jgi:hypothetical protein
MALALLAAVLVAGCGDDDGSTAAGSEDAEPTVETSQLSKRQFVKRVNAICQRGLEERTEAVEAYAEENPPANESAQEDLLVEAFVAVYPPSLETELEEIRELGAPQGDERQIEAILRTFRAYIDAVAELEDIEEKAEVDRTVNEFGRLAKKYGINECAVN